MIQRKQVLCIPKQATLEHQGIFSTSSSQQSLVPLHLRSEINRTETNYTSKPQPVTSTMRASTFLSGLLLLPASLIAAAEAVAPAVAPAPPQAPLPPPPSAKTYKLTIYTQPLTSHASLSRYEKLAKITYTHSSNANLTTISDYQPPSFLSPPVLAATDAVKLGFYSGGIGDEETWHGVLTAAGNFERGVNKTLKLFLDEGGRVWHLGFSATPIAVVGGKAGKGGKGEGVKEEGDKLNVEFVLPNKGLPPALNKPVVVNKEGKAEGEEEEQKSFIQK